MRYAHVANCMMPQQTLCDTCTMALTCTMFYQLHCILHPHLPFLWLFAGLRYSKTVAADTFAAQPQCTVGMQVETTGSTVKQKYGCRSSCSMNINVIVH
jgi:hypothetical protein